MVFDQWGSCVVLIQAWVTLLCAGEQSIVVLCYAKRRNLAFKKRCGGCAILKDVRCSHTHTDIRIYTNTHIHIHTYTLTHKHTVYMFSSWATIPSVYPPPGE
jgi:hypothetical protein